MKKPSTRPSGFSLMELLICLAVMMVVTVAAFPTITKNLQVIRLRSSAQDFASLLQRDRIQAVKNNRYYSLSFANGGQQACIDLNWNQQCDTGEPVIVLASNVSFVTDGSGPSVDPIACGAAGYSPCTGTFVGLNYKYELPTVLPSYNARGLPCVGNPTTPPPSWSLNAKCTEFDSTQGNLPVGFLYELRYTGAGGNSYAAVAITPSGLVSVWMYNGTSWGQE
jgi:prepilin-type N-terminal cleavage/methylation domain-containing protein